MKCRVARRKDQNQEQLHASEEEREGAECTSIVAQQKVLHVPF